MRLWELGEGAPRLAQTFRGPVREVQGVGFHGGAVVAAAADGTLHRWDLATGTAAPVRRGHATGMVELAVSANGAVLVTAGTDGQLLFWEDR